MVSLAPGRGVIKFFYRRVRTPEGNGGSGVVFAHLSILQFPVTNETVELILLVSGLIFGSYFADRRERLHLEDAVLGATLEIFYLQQIYPLRVNKKKICIARVDAKYKTSSL